MPIITKTEDLRVALQKHICKDGQNGQGYAFLNEVRTGTGFQRREGYADAVAMSLMPSRGLTITGFELKVSRGDWLRELKKPEKAEAFYKWCDRWFLVVGDKDIVKEGELPDTWGLIAPKGNGMGVIKASPPNENVEPVADRLFLASLMRSAVRSSATTKQLREQFEAGLKAGVEQGEYELKRAREDRDKLKEIVDTFQKESGVTMSGWYGAAKAEDVGRALKLVLSGEKDAGKILGRLARLGGDIEALLDDHGIDKENPPSEF